MICYGVEGIRSTEYEYVSGAAESIRSIFLFLTWYGVYF